MENLLQEIKYAQYLADQMNQQAHFERYIEECILITEGNNTIANIITIHEGFVDKIKDGIKKLLASIAKMWGKFLEAMNTLLKKDKAYLEKYKDIILKKKMKDYEYTMHNYSTGTKIIVQATVPQFNYQQMREELESDDKFIQKYFSNYISKDTKSSVFLDQVKAKFRGGSSQSTIKSSSLNMTDIYNYCYGFDTMKKSIEKDITSIKSAGNTALEVVNKMGRENQIAESTNIFKKDKYLSYVYESYILEGDGTETAPESGRQQAVKPAEADKPTTSKVSRKVNDAASDDSKASSVNKNIDDNGNKAADDDIEKNVQSVKEDTARINRYFKICGDFLGAKLTICEEIYKNYMDIIKMHVRDYVGTKDNVNDNKPQDNSSNYNDGDDVDNIFNKMNNPPKKEEKK